MGEILYADGKCRWEIFSGSGGGEQIDTRTDNAGLIQIAFVQVEVQQTNLEYMRL
jgi:hypothetical protein